MFRKISVLWVMAFASRNRRNRPGTRALAFAGEWLSCHFGTFSTYEEKKSRNSKRRWPNETVRCFGSETDALRTHINDLGFGGYSMDVFQESARFLCFHHRARFEETIIALRDARLGGLSNPREMARRGGHVRDLHNRIGDECAYAIEERVLTGLFGHDRGVSQAAAARQLVGTIATGASEQALMRSSHNHNIAPDAGRHSRTTRRFRCPGPDQLSQLCVRLLLREKSCHADPVKQRKGTRSFCENCSSVTLDCERPKLLSGTLSLDKCQLGEPRSVSFIPALHPPRRGESEVRP